ncbi:hypothetical protein HBH56_214070 [Parastagonospora nodorum]|uniref:Zn(2)-C6 fungal-type domain-containing protein n=1 Tax=Phaeosphaeria nodorum (strain SN15 / ATCC MYA-4574 / FGSC 10173) TaxID=321614 RepID=A0A7U2I100_PHANO|nr:hypothetical protein HBH56_214070 [Parastagonospora nodorum]QRC97814.1 hypothetical protein JI435_151590 [Parastagonospora nodorum SN15]KAH3923077.1 hypothetical protein HBH54_215740 [Parastagonospora nodorum]KAH3992826.1 hypothetical protein HBI10_211870 [Parastagonospora nodorum]KAH4029686.1 hypothetical protein HBI13_031180 [Parastagonospora nodorum]
MSSNLSGGRQLPTRVSNACDRCRRNKSRCDPYRPCSLCTRANVECVAGNYEQQPRSAKRKRTQGPSCEETVPPEALSVKGTASQAPPSQRLEETSNDRHDTAGQPQTEVIQDAESRRQSVTEAQVDSAMGIAQKIYQLSGQGTPVLRRTTSAIPGGDVYGKPPATRADRTQRRPILSIIGYSLPSAETTLLLLEEYFEAVHWFSLVIHEPIFRPKLESVMDGFAYPSQRSFLLLLSVVLGMGAWYKSHKQVQNPDHVDWRAIASSLVDGAGSRLTELMDQASVASVQACILLGSYYVYHGKPNLSFSLLGATIRTAQAIGLHRQALRGDVASTEERKRVWWTIYTWDRFASVTYGRPLGINEKDCNVTQPEDVFESPCFRPRTTADDTSPICYSSYQRELNKLYLTASPVIETIFGMRTMRWDDPIAAQHYLAKVMDATDRLWAWRRRLPPHLCLDLGSDCEPNAPRTSRVHQLQALSLQLTFDNLLIIFHRPSLAQHVDHLIRNQPELGHVSTPSPTSVQRSASGASPLFSNNAYSPLSVSQASSNEQWWDAALRTSKVTQMPQLAQLATDSHLVAFLAINLFNSAIVMAVLALTDPLSDRAQEVKRSITRIFRLQELLGKKTELSMQSNVVLKDVIQMLLQRESDAMLQPVLGGDRPVASGESSAQIVSEAPLMSVEDTLRLPMHLPMSNTNVRPDQGQAPTDKTLRLNESLASLQRVLPLSAEGPIIDPNMPLYEPQHGHSGPGQVFSEPDTWFNPDLHGLGDESSWADEGYDITGNGLYWFWNSAWSESRPS